MNRLHAFLFPKEWSKWIDSLCYERNGNYYLIQMKVRAKDNCKVFKTIKVEFVNNSIKEFYEFRANVLFNQSNEETTQTTDEQNKN